MTLGILDGKPEGKRPPGKPSRKGVDKAKMELSVCVKKAQRGKEE